MPTSLHEDAVSSGPTIDPLPNIAVPDDLLPGDGRFGSGPALIRREAVAALGSGAGDLLGTSHRRAGVREIVRSIRDGLRELYDLPDGYEVVLGVGGASLFWEVAAFSLIQRRSLHLVCGEFSSKFANLVADAPHLEDPVVHTAAPGSVVTDDPIPEVDTVALIHNETSTGVLAPVPALAVDSPLALVDGTSAAGAVTISPGAFDAYYFSPQKAFGSDGGLWVTLLSPRALTRVEEIAAGGRWIPPMQSLATALENSRKDQTYNTPALATLFLLADQIAWILRNGGLAWAAERTRRSSGILYDWAERSDFATPFVADPVLRSPTVVTIDLGAEIAADTVSGVLRANGVVDTESYRKLGENQLRIATFPNVDPADMDRLTRTIDYVVARL